MNKLNVRRKKRKAASVPIDESTMSVDKQQRYVQFF